MMAKAYEMSKNLNIPNDIRLIHSGDFYIKAIRSAKTMNYKQLEQRLNIPALKISAIENGRAELSFDELLNFMVAVQNNFPELPDKLIKELTILLKNEVQNVLFYNQMKFFEEKEKFLRKTFKDSESEKQK